MSKHIPFRYDFVGSFLRPARLKEARAGFQAGKIDAAQLKKVEDECITELVAKQKKAGYHVITEGALHGIWTLCGALTV
jgi:5-methyltetrahydropteroyltriglutamate--homocysteine methyltransferase